MFMNLAYIDPGSGSIIQQVLLASCIGGLAIFWGKVKALFGGKKAPPPGKAPDKTDDGTPSASE